MAAPATTHPWAARARTRSVAAGAVLAWAAAAPLQAAPLGQVLNTNQTRHVVNLASNAEAPPGGIATPFTSDSLALSPGGVLYTADGFGNLWDIGGPPIPVGPTGRTQIADLDWGTNGPASGLWGYSNASQELFFHDLGSNSVTYAVTLSLPPAAVVAGVAHQASTGDIFLAAHNGPNNDVLLRVPASSSTVLMVGAMSHGDSFSHISDIDFDAGGALYAMTWFHRWFYSVDPTTAVSTFVSAGPHRDATALALSPVPEPATAALLAGGLAVLGLLRPGRAPRRSPARCAPPHAPSGPRSASSARSPSAPRPR